MRTVRAQPESWPVAGRFAISRGAITEVHVVVVSLTEEGHTGRGECFPYARYGHDTASVMRDIESVTADMACGMTRPELARRLPEGPARNALDAALWDLESRQTGIPAGTLAGLPKLHPVVTAFTLGLDSPEAMAAAARKAAERPLLKIKLGGGLQDRDRLHAVRDAAPDARLIVDANEGWEPVWLERMIADCADAGVELIEQPLPADRDDILTAGAGPVPICADESIHGLPSLDRAAGRYDAINIKLDKTGGLTAALELQTEARARGLSVMVGCMVATSLAMAPAMLVAQKADFVDLDGPLLLARDRPHGIRYTGSVMDPPSQQLWGGG